MAGNIVNEVGAFKNLSATTQVYTGACQLLGIFVASASATPTIAVYDQTSAAVPIIANTFTPLAGTYYPLPASCVNGIRVVISGTVDCTVFYSI